MANISVISGSFDIKQTLVPSSAPSLSAQISLGPFFFFIMITKRGDNSQHDVLDFGQFDEYCRFGDLLLL